MAYIGYQWRTDRIPKQGMKLRHVAAKRDGKAWRNANGEWCIIWDNGVSSVAGREFSGLADNGMSTAWIILDGQEDNHKETDCKQCGSALKTVQGFSSIYTFCPKCEP